MWIFISLVLGLAYLLAWASSTLPDLRNGKIITPAENPRGALFWWAKRC